MFLKGAFLKNGYTLGFIDSCFKKVIDNVLTESPVKLAVEKCLLILLLPFLGDISLQLRTKLRKSLKNILNCCKVQIVFKSQRRLSGQFPLMEPFPYGLMSKVVYKYRCGRCNSSYYSEMDSHLRVRAGEHISLSPLTFKHCKLQRKVQFVTICYSVIMTPPLKNSLF